MQFRAGFCKRVGSMRLPFSCRKEGYADRNRYRCVRSHRLSRDRIPRRPASARVGLARLGLEGDIDITLFAEAGSRESSFTRHCPPVEGRWVFQQWRGDSPLRPQPSPGEYAVVVVADNDHEDRVQPSPPMPASVVRRRSVSVAVHPGGERIELQASAISTT